MLAIARVLRSGARLILLDEPTEGLAPVIVDAIADLILEMKRDGITILLVEQNLYSALSLADRCYVIDQGEIHFEGTPDELRSNHEVLSRYLHV